MLIQPFLYLKFASQGLDPAVLKGPEALLKDVAKALPSHGDFIFRYGIAALPALYETMEAAIASDLAGMMGGSAQEDMADVKVVNELLEVPAVMGSSPAIPLEIRKDPVELNTK